MLGQHTPLVPPQVQVAYFWSVVVAARYSLEDSGLKLLKRLSSGTSSSVDGFSEGALFSKAVDASLWTLNAIRRFPGKVPPLGVWPSVEKVSGGMYELDAGSMVKSSLLSLK